MTECRSNVRRLLVTCSLALLTIGLVAAADDPSGKIESVMKKVNKDNTKLRKFSKYSSEKLQTEGAEAAKVANEMVGLIESVQNNTYYIEEVKKKGTSDADAKWKKSNQGLVGHLKDYAAAAEKHDSAAVKKSFSAAQRACTECHDVFRPEESE